MIETVKMFGGDMRQRNRQSGLPLVTEEVMDRGKGLIKWSVAFLVVTFGIDQRCCT
jgi:hypothetical protein